MQPAGSKKNPSEVWVMYVDIGEVAKLSIPKKKIITAWRYPGISPIGEPIPIPEEILSEIGQEMHKVRYILHSLVDKKSEDI